MKTLKLFLALLLINVFTSSSYSQTGWILKSTGNNFSDVFFINELQGWMIGDSGGCYATYDGAMNWTGLDSKTKNKLNSVFFIDANTGWAAGNKKTIIKTTNGGDDWTVQMTSSGSSNLYGVYFPTIDTGFAIGDSSLKTTNGGTTWETMVSLATGMFGAGIYFSSGSKGIATQGSGRVTRTSTGGFSWVANAASDPLNRWGIYFVNANTGWVTGNGISMTTNGGDNWISQTSGAGFSTLYGVWFTDANSGWTVGSIGVISGNSEIRRTTDGGTNWTGQSSGTQNILYSVSAMSGSNAVIVGNTGTILLTTNSGTNWNNHLFTFGFPFAPTLNLNCIEFYDDNTGWAGGQVGYVSKTTNGASTWTTVMSSSFGNINSIDFLSMDTGWICQDGGVIQKSLNGGTNWSSQSTGVSERLGDISMKSFYVDSLFTYQQIGWSVGNSGTILWTNNGGVNWSLQISPTSANLYSVRGISYKVAIACGDSGKILKTTNGGTNWFTYVSGSGILRSLAFADDYNGICAGDSGKVFKTTDQGDTWTFLSGPSALTTKILYSAAANYDMMEKYVIVGQDGVVLTSSDGGLTWFMSTSGSKIRFNGVDMPSETVNYIVGNTSTVLKTYDGGVLPVELTSFLSSVSGNNVTLNWQTASESNNSGFEILRSAQNENWINAGFVQGIGNSNTAHNYSFTDRNLNTGKYKYRLKQIEYNGSFKFYDLDNDVIIGAPSGFSLLQNYPNPFNPKTVISYSLPQNSFITLKVYDILGKEVATLVNQKQDAGFYSVEFPEKNGMIISSGVYFYKIVAGGFLDIKRMVLIK